MSLDKSTLLNIQKMIAFLQLLVLYLSDANREINKYKLVVSSRFQAVALVLASYAAAGFAYQLLS
jgi:hypothetical protein